MLKGNSVIDLFIYKDDELSASGFNDDDRFPYPYIFKPPKPPDDLAIAPQVQVQTPLKIKDPVGQNFCQYCGRELTEEEQLTHSCKKKPE